MHADIRSDAAENQVLNALASQNAIEIGSSECSFTWLVDDDLRVSSGQNLYM